MTVSVLEHKRSKISC